LGVISNTQYGFRKEKSCLKNLLVSGQELAASMREEAWMQFSDLAKEQNRTSLFV